MGNLVKKRAAIQVSSPVSNLANQHTPASIRCKQKMFPVCDLGNANGLDHNRL
jgi:hypothetical protein